MHIKSEFFSDIKNNIKNNMEILFVKTDKSAQTPSKGTELSAGYDLYTIESGYIDPLQRKMIDTGIKMSIPEGYYGRIAPRSGLALKNGINIMAGVIDSDYRGNIKCILHNTDTNTFEYKVGDRIAQIIIEKHYNVSFIETETLENTKRNGGFGSTG